MKTSILQTQLFYRVRFVTPMIVSMILVLSTFSYSQWTSPGVNTFTHGSSGGPEIMGFGAQLELIEFEQAAAGSVNGLKFMKQQGLSDITEAYFHYATNFNKFHMSKTGTSAGSKFNVDMDTGDTEITGILDITGGNTALRLDGDEAIWYDGSQISWGFGGDWNRFADPISIGGSIVEPPTGTALLTTDGREIKMVGNNSYIQWHTSTNSDPTGAFSAFLGSNQNGTLFAESNLAKVIIDGETGINFLVSDNSTAMVIDAASNVGIGTASPAYKLQVVGNADITGELSAASDVRLKKDIEGLDNALDKIVKLNPVSYKFKTSQFPSMDLPAREKIGFLAQEVEEVLPNLVSTGTQASDIDGNSFESMSVNYIEMIPILTKAMQEQQALIEDLQKDVASLKKMLNSK